MNTSSWNCFPWNQNRKEQINDERRNQDRCSGSNAEVPNEQFANLLGGELPQLFCESKPFLMLYVFILNDNEFSGRYGISFDNVVLRHCLNMLRLKINTFFTISAIILSSLIFT